MKDGSSLVVIPSSIPSSATRGLNMDLSSEGSEDILEDPDDELVLKKRISNSDDEGSVPPEAEFMGIYLSPFLLFCFAKFILPLFFVIFSLHVCTCISPLLQSPFICTPISVLYRDF